MLVINELLDSFREFQTILSASAKSMSLNSSSIFRRDVCQVKPESLIVDYSAPSYSGTQELNNGHFSLFDNINVEQTINFLKKDGFFLGINLPQDVVQEIWQFAIHTPCYGNGKTNLGFYYADKEQAQAKYGNALVSGNYYNTALLCPAIKKLERDSLLLEIARQYLEAEPVHQANQLRWNFPVESTIYERRQAVQMFHCDSDDRRSLKFSFYITDVDLCSSPHVCVRRSHGKKKLSPHLLQRGLSFQEITKYYGYKNIVPICGKAGFGFVEETGCFHKETPPGSKDRLLLQIEFAVKNYGNQNEVRENSQLEFLL